MVAILGTPRNWSKYMADQPSAVRMIKTVEKAFMKPLKFEFGTSPFARSRALS